jgi:hypothetical protein
MSRNALLSGPRSPRTGLTQRPKPTNGIGMVHGHRCPGRCGGAAGGNSPTAPARWGRWIKHREEEAHRSGIGSPERTVVDEVTGSSQLDGISWQRRDPVDGCNSGEGLRILGKKKGMRHNPNCKGDMWLWISPGEGDRWWRGFKSSAPGGVPVAGGGH